MQTVQIVEDGKKQYDPLTGTPLTHEACDKLTIVPKTGALNEEQFDEKVKNLVTFLAYSANPVKLQHQRIGTYVLLYLAFFFSVRLPAQARILERCALIRFKQLLLIARAQGRL